MQYRTLGRTGLRVSEVGYGGGRVAPTQDRRALIDMLHAAFEVGLNYFDTAPDYGGGFSEDIIGEAVKGRRDECIIATKTEAFDSKGIMADVAGSLKRLGINVIDVLQFHGGGSARRRHSRFWMTVDWRPTGGCEIRGRFGF